MAHAFLTPEPQGKKKSRSRLRIGYLSAEATCDLRKNEGCKIHIEQIVEGLRKAQQEVRLIAVQPGEAIIREPLDIPHHTLDNDDGISQLSENNHIVRRPRSIRRSLMGSAARQLCRVLGLPYVQSARSYRVYKECRQYFQDCDLLHERFALYSAGGVLTARSLRIPLVLEVNAPLIEEWETFAGPLPIDLRRLAILCTKANFRSATVIIVVSTVLGEMIVSRWDVNPGKIFVLPNAADIEAFNVEPSITQSYRKRYGLHSSPVVAFVGALQKWHGVDILLEAFCKVLNAEPEAKLLLVGGGPLHREVIRKNRAMGIEQSVVLTGDVDHADVPGLLSVADVAVAPYPKLPVDFYFSPLKLFEYMAIGKATVASRLGQIAEVIIDGKTGLLVEPSDPVQLAGAIVKLLRDESLRQHLGFAARNTVRQNYSWDHYIGKLLGIYEAALARSRTRENTSAGSSS